MGIDVTHICWSFTTRGPQASDLDSGDAGGEEALRQSGGPSPTAHSNLCAGDRHVHLSVREEEEDSLRRENYISIESVHQPQLSCGRGVTR